MSTAALEPRVDLRRGRLEMMLKVLDVDGAVTRVRGGWRATGQPWTYDAERYERVAETRRAEQAAIREYVAGGRCRMAFLRAALDDPALAAEPGWTCGRCDVCLGETHDVLPDDAAVGAGAGLRCRSPASRSSRAGSGRPAWRALDVPLSGKIPAVRARRRRPRGRAAGRDRLGQRAARPVRGGARWRGHDGELPASLRAPVLAVLDAWAPAVDGVVLVRSATRPALVEHLAAGVARHLGVPLVGAVAPLAGLAAGAGTT